jgi:hypothetical protein
VDVEYVQAGRGGRGYHNYETNKVVHVPWQGDTNNSAKYSVRHVLGVIIMCGVSMIMS